MERRRLLVVEEEFDRLGTALGALEARYAITRAGAFDEALDLAQHDHFDVVIANILRGGTKVEMFLQHFRHVAASPAILTIAQGESLPERGTLQKLGVLDCIEKPFTVDRIVRTVQRALEDRDLREENQTLKRRLREHERLDSLLGHSMAIERVRDRARVVAATRVPILVTGERGSGKKVICREIHRMSDRQDNPVFTVSCASIPETLLEIELFGRERESLVGPDHPVPGKLDFAHTGTIILDEIGELSASMQAKLLRVIQDGEFERRGGARPIQVDVRVIATTRRSLKEDVEKGTFREDLFYSLNVVPIHAPPLRDRRKDIPLLVNHFIEVHSSENRKAPVKLTPTAMRKLCNARWPGNVRELKNVVERAVILASGTTLDENYFQFDDERDDRFSRMEQAFRCGSIREMEKLMIVHRLQDNDQNRTRTAKTLDISVRTLRNKLREYREAASGEQEVLMGSPKS